MNWSKILWYLGYTTDEVEDYIDDILDRYKDAMDDHGPDSNEAQEILNKLDGGHFANNRIREICKIVRWRLEENDSNKN